MKRGTITIEPAHVVVVLSSDGTIRMAAEEIASMFHVTAAKVERHIEKIFAAHELDEREVRTERHTIRNGKRHIIEYYNLDMIIALCFRIDTPPSKAFRRWIAEQIVRTARPKPTTPIFLQIHSYIGGTN